MTPLELTIILFCSLLVVLASGLPIAFGLGGLALIFIFIQMGTNGVYLIASTAWTTWTDGVLISLPLFILMAEFLTQSGVGEDLYEVIYRWMGRIKGGLAMGTVGICTLFAAMSGVSAVGTITMGLVALPSMLKRGYDKQIAVGCISAGGTLGILIPPSIPFIIYAYMAQESVGQLFMAGVFPGLMLAGLFIAYIGIACKIKPSLGPPVPEEERFTWKQKFSILRGLILPILLIVTVLGFMYMGVTTATEAAGIGAFGAFLCVLIYRRFSWKMLRLTLSGTFRTVAFCGWIMVGAKLFSYVYSTMGAATLVNDLVSSGGMSPWLILVMTQVIVMFLGCFMDPIGIMMLTLPIFVPLMNLLDFNLVWFGVLLVINLEMGYLTPPFGVNLFYMRSIVPKGITMGDIYKSIVPFVALQLIGLIIIMLFPQIALWLPGFMQIAK